MAKLERREINALDLIICLHSGHIHGSWL